MGKRFGNISQTEMDRLAHAMNQTAQRATRWGREGQHEAATLEQFKLGGMEDAARAMGFNCLCVPAKSGRYGAQSCMCASTWPQLDKRIKAFRAKPAGRRARGGWGDV